jgi:hypothetical protein
MKYYKIKKENDNRRRKDGSIYVANELYTEKEKEKYNIPEDYCDVIEISKRNVFFCFGARFSK